MTNDGPRTSSTVTSALRILQALTRYPHGAGVTELANELGIVKSSVHVYLATFLESGFVDQLKSGKYRLGFSAFDIGSAVPDSARFGGPLASPMRELADRSGESVSLAVRSGTDAMMVQRFETKHVLRAEIRVGTRMPLPSCASGKFFLAHMTEDEVDELYPTEDLPVVTAWSIQKRSILKECFREIRQCGYALQESEFIEGVAGAGTGVQNSAGRHVAALSIAGPILRFKTSDWINPLLDTAQEMSNILSQFDSGPRTR